MRKIRFKQIIGPVALFVVIFGLLIFPWPGWNEIYGDYFRALGQTAFGGEKDQRIVQFNPYSVDHGSSSLDTQVMMGNRALISSDGKGPVRKVDLDSRSIGWLPTALTIGLILATPVPWKQKAWAIVWGLISVQAFILFSLQIWIWDLSSALSLASVPPFFQSILDALEYTLLTQLGASFSVPVLIWILVCLRRKDFAALQTQFSK